MSSFEFLFLPPPLISCDSTFSSPSFQLPAVTDDPQQRKPDISRAEEVLGWKPSFPVQFGIKETVQYFKSEFDLYENWGHPGH